MGYCVNGDQRLCVRNSRGVFRLGVRDKIRASDRASGESEQVRRMGLESVIEDTYGATVLRGFRHRRSPRTVSSNR